MCADMGSFDSQSETFTYINAHVDAGWVIVLSHDRLAK